MTVVPGMKAILGTINNMVMVDSYLIMVTYMKDSGYLVNFQGMDLFITSSQKECTKASGLITNNMAKASSHGTMDHLIKDNF